MSMDEALAAVNAGTLELFSTAAARAPLLDYNEAIRQQDLGRSVVYDGAARNLLGRSDRCEKRGGRASNLTVPSPFLDSRKSVPSTNLANMRASLGMTGYQR